MRVSLRACHGRARPRSPSEIVNVRLVIPLFRQMLQDRSPLRVRIHLERVNRDTELDEKVEGVGRKETPASVYHDNWVLLDKRVDLFRIAESFVGLEVGDNLHLSPSRLGGGESLFDVALSCFFFRRGRHDSVAIS